MSAPPADVVRSAYAALERGDLPALLALLDEEVVIVDPDLPGGGTFHGHDGAAHYLEQLLGAFDSHTLAVVRLIEQNGRVIAALHHEFRAQGSDAAITLDDAHVWTVVNGRATRIEMYLDLDAALQRSRDSVARGREASRADRHRHPAGDLDRLG